VPSAAVLSLVVLSSLPQATSSNAASTATT